MDSAGRAFAALTGASLVLIGYGICALVTYALAPIAADGVASVAPSGFLALAAIGAVFGASLLRAAAAIRRHRVAGRRLAQLLRRSAVAPSPSLRAAADATGLAPRVVLIESDDPFSFVYGLRAPRVAISSGLVGRLSGAELRAVLEHERYHVGNLDPLRDLVGRTLGASMFFAPVVGALHRRYATARELAADRRAIRALGPRPLAGALLAVLTGPESERTAGVQLGDPDLLAARLAGLEGGRAPRAQRLDRGPLIASVVGLVVLAALFLALDGGVGGEEAMARLGVEFTPGHLLEEALACVVVPLCLAATSYRLIARSVGRALGPS